MTTSDESYTPRSVQVSSGNDGRLRDHPLDEPVSFFVEGIEPELFYVDIVVAGPDTRANLVMTSATGENIVLGSVNFLQAEHNARAREAQAGY